MKNKTHKDYSKLNDCKACHGTHNVVSPKMATSPMHESNSLQYCGKCHDDVAKAHSLSEHKALEGDNRTPSCLSCHRQAVTLGSGVNALQLKKNQENFVFLAT